jgi:molybdate transport system permease protein
MKTSKRFNNKDIFQISVSSYLIIVVITICFLLISPIIYTGGSGLISAFSSKETLFSIKFSILSCLISVSIAGISGLIISYGMSRYNIPFKKWIELILYLPIVLPPLVLGLSLLILLGPILGKELQSLGLNFVFTPLGVIVGQYSVALPFMIQIFKNTFDSLPESLFEAAKMDGANEYMIFTKIILPMCSSHLLSGFSLGFGRSIGEFGATMMLAGMTRYKTETLPASIYLNIATGDMNKAIASAVVLLLVSIFSLGIIQLSNNQKKLNGYC